MQVTGHPLKFPTVEVLEKLIEEYFIMCDPHPIQKQVVVDGEIVTVNAMSEQEPYTITGLALALGTSRRTLLNYEKKEVFFHTIKQAKVKIENYTEKYLFTGKNPTGGIFNLVNNYGWENKSRSDVTTTGSLEISTKDREEGTRVKNILINAEPENS